ncbi:DNA polymerase III subunit beta [Patescibacteria group bacterium]|nr:DNA polymerase III subunit beta [Patescibacteria group bacterium]
MKISCTKENLHQGLAIVSHISGKNANLPILNNVLLKADVSGLKLTATNLDMTVSCHVRGKVEQPGEYTVPARLIADYVSLLPDERIDIDLLDSAIAISCKSSKTKMHGLPAGEFPLIPQVQGGITFSVPVKALDAALSQTLFSVATNEARQVLTGVYLYFNGDARTVTVAATDSYRLGEKVIPLIGEQLGERRVVVPARTLGELRRVFSVLRDSVETPENVDIELTDNQVAFRYGNVELSSRTIDGVYPDYRQIIPKLATTEVIVPRNEFMQAVKRTSLFSKQGLFDVKLDMKPDSNEIVLSANDAGRGEHTVAVSGDMKGSANAVTLNYRYLLDGVSAMTSESIVVKIIDSMNPCVVVPHEQKDEQYLYIVMPIRQ